MNIVIASSKAWFELHEDITSKHNVILINCESDLTADNLTKINPDIIFFPHWNWKVSPEIHESFTCIVFHTAPLPYGRGGSPIQNLILEGHETAPVCALKMIDDLDAGPIYTSQIVSLEGNLHDIFRRINQTINDLILNLISGDLPKPTPQDGDVHYFKRLGETDNAIPTDIELKQFFDYIRMLDDDLYPQSFIKYGQYKIEFSSAEFEGDVIRASCKIKKC